MELSAEDLLFLKELQTKLKTQETDCQASPRFWVVEEEKREWGISDDYCDSYVLIDEDEGNVVANNVTEAIAYIKENNEGYLDVLFTDDDFYKLDECNSLYDVLEFLEDMDVSGYSVVGYRDSHTVAKNTFFLTKESCKNHIELNGYHYKKPHTYAMTAWRNPEFERLLTILTNTDWDQ